MDPVVIYVVVAIGVWSLLGALVIAFACAMSSQFSRRKDE
jgi:hypothetical protein